MNIKNISGIIILIIGIILLFMIDFRLFRGIIEIILAMGSLLAYQRSRDDMIQKITIIAFFVLLFTGLYDISFGFGWILA